MASSHLRISVGVSIPADMLEEIDAHVDEEESNRSAFIRKAVRRHIDEKNND